MYRVYLFHELIDMAGKEAFAGKRILEIGPKDGLDSLKLAGLGPERTLHGGASRKKRINLFSSGSIRVACPHKIIYENILSYLPHDKF